MSLPKKSGDIERSEFNKFPCSVENRSNSQGEKSLTITAHRIQDIFNLLLYGNSISSISGIEIQQKLIKLVCFHEIFWGVLIFILLMIYVNKSLLIQA